MSFDLANPQDRKALGLPPLDMDAIFIKLYLGEELSDEEIFAIRPLSWPKNVIHSGICWPARIARKDYHLGDGS